jgi:hypothetical protein
VGYVGAKARGRVEDKGTFIRLYDAHPSGNESGRNPFQTPFEAKISVVPGLRDDSVSWAQLGDYTMPKHLTSGNLNRVR